MKIILTGATGMAGEGVLLECIENSAVTEVLIVGRRHYDISHPKLKELLVPDFLKIDEYASQLAGYDACFFCAGVSSIGMKEDLYTKFTYETTIAFARACLSQNPNIIFNYITGRGTDSSEKGKVMWARVKGKTENELMRFGFKGQYNFRPALMLPSKGQKSIKAINRFLANTLKYIMSKSTITLQQLGKAMIHTASSGYPRPILEVADIKIAANETHS